MESQKRKRPDRKVTWKTASNIPGSVEFIKNVSGNIGSAKEEPS